MNSIDLLIEPLHLVTPEGAESMHALFEKCKVDTEKIIFDLLKYAVKIGQSNRSKQLKQNVSRIGVVVSTAMSEMKNAEDILAVMRELKVLLLNDQIANSIKLSFINCIGQGVTAEEQLDSYVLQEGVIEYLDGLIEQESIGGQSVKNWKREKLKETMSIEFDSLFNQMLRIMAKSVMKVEDKVKYGDKAITILLKYIKLKNIPETRDAMLRIDVSITILQFLEEINKLDSEILKTESTLSQFCNHTSIKVLIEHSLALSCVIHPNISYLCAFCSKKNQGGEISLLKNITFKIIYHIFAISCASKTQTIWGVKAQDQLCQMLVVGLLCFINFGQKKSFSLKRDYSQKQELACILLDIYTLYLKKHKSKIENLFRNSISFKSLFLFKLLRFTPYERDIFLNNSDQFLDTIEYFMEQDESDTYRSKIYRLFTFIAQVIPSSKNFFLNIAVYNLEKNNQIYVVKNRKKMQNIYMLKNDICYLLYLIFWRKEDQSVKQCQFFKAMIKRKCLAKIDDITLALVLILVGKHRLKIVNFSEMESMLIVDLALTSKNRTLNLIALVFLEAISQKVFSLEYFNMAFKKIFNQGEGETNNEHIYWNILQTMIKKHFMKFHLYTKSYLLKQIRATLSIELFLKAKEQKDNYTTIYNCIQLLKVYLCNMLFTQDIHPFLYRNIVEISSVYPLLPRQDLKEEFRNVFIQILNMEHVKNGCLALRLVQNLPYFLEEYGKKREPSYLKIFHKYILIFSKNNEQGVSTKINPIFRTVFNNISKKIYSKTSEEPFEPVYCQLLVLNLYILYFGADLKKQDLNQVKTLCTQMLQLDQEEMMMTRLRNTLFACSFFLPYQCYEMEILSQFESGYFKLIEYEILLQTLQVYFSTTTGNGGIHTYKYLLFILYKMFQKDKHFDFVGYNPDNWYSIVIQTFSPAIYCSQDAKGECTRVYQLFRKQKYQIYLELMEVLNEKIRNFFVAIDESIREKEAYPLCLKPYDSSNKEYLKNNFPHILSTNQFRKSPPEIEMQKLYSFEESKRPLFTDILESQEKNYPKIVCEQQ